MRHIYGIGEALLDVIFKDHQPIGATAGGSTLNAIVSLGRMGYHPYLISEIGDDRIGDIIDDFLLKNGISDKYLFRRKGNRSPLALAFLDDNNDAEYEIFKDYAAQSLHEDFPPFAKNDIVVFGSFFSINPAFRPQLVKYLKAARDKGAIIVYDPNYRNHHAHKRGQMKASLEENFSLAHIVRGSNEDFKNIYGLDDMDEMAKKISAFCPNVIITANSQGTYLRTSNFSQWYPSLPIEPISTIGAGDNFNAGIIHGLLHNDIGTDAINGLTGQQWQNIIAPAIAFASKVCCSLENYVPDNFSEVLPIELEKYFELMIQQADIKFNKSS
jgi:fructokinase